MNDTRRGSRSQWSQELTRIEAEAFFARSTSIGPTTSRLVARPESSAGGIRAQAFARAPFPGAGKGSRRDPAESSIGLPVRNDGQRDQNVRDPQVFADSHRVGAGWRPIREYRCGWPGCATGRGLFHVPSCSPKSACSSGPPFTRPTSTPSLRTATAAIYPADRDDRTHPNYQASRGGGAILQLVPRQVRPRCIQPRPHGRASILLPQSAHRQHVREDFHLILCCNVFIYSSTAFSAAWNFSGRVWCPSAISSLVRGKPSPGCGQFAPVDRGLGICQTSH